MIQALRTQRRCPVCFEVGEEMGKCQHGTDMCVTCWMWSMAPCCGGPDRDDDQEE